MGVTGQQAEPLFAVARAPSLGVLSWAIDVCERYGRPLGDGRVLVPLSQAELSERCGWGRNHGGVSRRLHELRRMGDDVVVRSRDGIVFDVDLLTQGDERVGRLRGAEGLRLLGAERPPRSTGARAGGRDEHRDLLAELATVRAEVIEALLRERVVLERLAGLDGAPAQKDTELRPRENARFLAQNAESPRDSARLSQAALNDNKKKSFESKSSSASDSFEAPLLTISTRANTVRANARGSDWRDDEIETLLEPLRSVCRERGISGPSYIAGLVTAFRAAGWGREQIAHHQFVVIARMRSGARVQSPFGLLHRMATADPALAEAEQESFPVPRATRAERGDPAPMSSDPSAPTSVALGDTVPDEAFATVDLLASEGEEALRDLDARLEAESPATWRLLSGRPALLRHARAELLARDRSEEEARHVTSPWLSSFGSVTDDP